MACTRLQGRSPGVTFWGLIAEWPTCVAWSQTLPLPPPPPPLQTCQANASAHPAHPKGQRTKQTNQALTNPTGRPIRAPPKMHKGHKRTQTYQAN